MKQPLISNLILRIEETEANPHAELEDVSTLNEKIYVKDYDVFRLKSEKDVLNAILNAAKIAAEITVGKKYIHISMQHEISLLRLTPYLLHAIAKSGCTIEIF